MSLSETESAARSDTTGSPGTLLGTARQEQNLSVGDVARQLKLTVHQVEALEAGEYHKLPGPVFVRGFIRNYARLLKLDPEGLVRSAVRTLPQEEERPPAPPSQDIPFPTVAPRRWRRYAIAIAVAAVALAVYEFYLSEPRPVVTRQGSAPPSLAPAVREDTGEARPSGPSAPEGPGAAAASTVSDSGQAASQTQPAAAGGQSATLDAPAASPRQEPPPALAGSDARDDAARGPGEHEVRMVFEKESWVEIRDRTGKAIFSQLNRSGTEKRVNGKPPLSVIVGNSHGVRLTYDDQPVDLSRHTKVDVARLTLP